MNEGDYTIIQTYQLEYRGIANYYRLAYNMHTLNKLEWTMRTSLLKTLATKHKVSVPKVAKKYKAELVVNDKKYKVLQVTLPRQGKKPLVATWGGIPLTWDIQATVNDQPRKVWNKGRSELEKRLLDEINRSGEGSQGLGGKASALGVKIGVNHRHTSSYCVSVSVSC